MRTLKRYLRRSAPVYLLVVVQLMAPTFAYAQSTTLSWFGFKALLYVVSWISSMILTVIGWLLKASANLFDALVQYTIVDFGGTVTSFGILNGVQTVWSAFRDISNIAIIGMFVFVAISMILGNQSFGTRRFVARVLLVAILINFSLLFTKLAIDASHIVARQFYNGIVSVSTTPGGQPGQAPDIAKAFLNRAGLMSGFDTSAQLRDIGRKADNISAMLAYTLAIGTFMLAFAISFIYGSYLLAFRAVLLIFLLLASSLAFASNLIPKFREHRYGWSGWWDALIKNALLAPLMMMFLWAALTVLQPRSGGATIGAFFNNPADTNTWGALIVYLLVAGMLFLSLRLASSFSTSIPGFTAITGAAKTGLGSLGLLAGGFGGVAGRAVIGRTAQRMYEQSKGGFMERGGMVSRDLKVRSGAIPRATNVFTGKGLQQAIDRFGSQALKTATTSSFNAARAGTALSDKYKDVMRKQALAFEGKGGVAAADKTKKEAQKKTTDEAYKELAESMKSGAQAKQVESRQIYDSERENIAKERRLAAEQAGKEKDIVKQNEGKVIDSLKTQKTDVEQREKILTGKTGKVFDEQRDVLKAEKSRIDRETKESQAKIEAAEQMAQEAKEREEDKKAIDREAYQKMDAQMKEKDGKENTEAKGVDVKFSEDEGFERESFRSMYLKKRKEDAGKKKRREALEDIKDSEGEEYKKPPVVGDTPKESGGGAGGPKK